MTPDEPVDDLRADITQAFEADVAAQDGGEAPEPAFGQPEAAPPAPGEVTTPVERARDAQGRFTSQPQPGIADQANRAVADAAAAAQQRTQVVDPAAAGRAPAGPPPGWSPRSKAAYDQLPDFIKNDIAKRETEMSQGLAKLAEYKNLDPYVEMARNSRTTLPEALARYVKAEQVIEADPYSGLLWLANSYKVDPVQFMYGMCRMYNIHPLQLVQAIGGDMPNQTGEAPPPSYQSDPVAMQQLQAMNERLAYMEQEREQVENQSINGQIEAFAANPANKYFENVRHHMAHIIRTMPEDARMTLKDVYDQACYANPEIRELLINERTRNGTAQPRNRMQGSLPTGSPLQGGTLTRNEPAPTLREEIERAYQEHS